jgi:hypothetical protein
VAMRPARMRAVHDFDLDSRVQRKPGIPWKRLEAEAVILDLESGDYFELDELGCRIWEALDGELTLAAHAQSIAREYEADPELVRSDVMAFVDELFSRGLVERLA